MLNRQLLTLTAVFAFAVFHLAATVVSAPPTQDELAQAIERLGHPRFDVRRQATDLLWAAGEQARPWLEEAAKSKNAEVRFRARSVLEQFKYSILPTTSAEDVQQIRRFRQGDLRVRANVLKELADRGSIKVVLRLLSIDANQNLQAAVRPKLVGYLEQHGRTGDVLRLASEAPSEMLRKEFIRIALTRYEKQENFSAIVRIGETQDHPDVRRGIRTWIEKSSSRFLPVLMDQGEFATVERLLELGAVGDVGTRQLAVYALLRGELDQRIERLRSQVSAGGVEDADATRLLVYLLRAKGELAEARHVAEQLGDSGAELMRSLLYDLGDWPAAAAFNQSHPRPSDLRGARTERLGFQAAFQRLAGDDPAFRQTISELDKLATRDAQLTRACAKVMLIHGVTARAIELKQGENQIEAFQLMCQQLRRAEAFRWAKIGDTEDARNVWFSQAARDAKSNAKRAHQHWYIGLYAARMLADVGHRGEARQAFEKLGEAVRNDVYVARIRKVCETELKSGFNDLAFQHATIIVGKDRSILSTVFPTHHDMADTWWEYFRLVHREEPYANTLGRIRKLLYRSRSQTESPIDLTKLAAAVEEKAANLSPAKQARWFYAVGRTATLWGRQDLAKQFLGRAADRHAGAALSYADQFVANKDWIEAARWYRKCWELDHRRSGAIFLQGKMLANAGQPAEGQRLMALARLMPLADSHNRYQMLAAPLKSHQLIDEATAQWKLIVRQGDWSEEDVLSAVRDLGNISEQQDLMTAAHYWEQMLLACLQLKFSFTQPEGYVHIPQLVQKTRARGLLATGKVEEAIPFVKLAHAICPGDADFVEQVVPELDRAGRPELADQLFDETFDILAQTCEVFAYSASVRHTLARTSARCNRRLDEALQAARRAVDLSPRTAVYLDTLGEVHFRRGELDKAIECAERCLDLEPSHAGYQKQLDRFRQSQ